MLRVRSRRDLRLRLRLRHWLTPNIAADPRFVDADGPDNDPNTPDDNDYSLRPDSPCIDAGDPAYVWTADARDLPGHVRLWDGNRDGIARVDVGAFEFGASCLGDLDDNGTIGLTDLSTLLSNFGESAIPNDGDLNANGVIDLEDLSILLALFGSSCG